MRIERQRGERAYGWPECGMTKYVLLSERNIGVMGEVLEAEVRDEAQKEVVGVERVRLLDYVWAKPS